MSVCINVWISPEGKVIPVNIAEHATKAFEILYGKYKDKASKAHSMIKNGLEITDCYQNAEKELIKQGWFKINQWPNSIIHLVPNIEIEKISNPIRKAITTLFTENNIPLRALKGGHPFKNWKII
jgi:hypothetical protein